jgi:hypothetical protein
MITLEVRQVLVEALRHSTIKNKKTAEAELRELILNGRGRPEAIF